MTGFRNKDMWPAPHAKFQSSGATNVPCLCFDICPIQLLFYTNCCVSQRPTPHHPASCHVKKPCTGRSTQSKFNTTMIYKFKLAGGTRDAIHTSAIDLKWGGTSSQAVWVGSGEAVREAARNGIFRGEIDHLSLSSRPAYSFDPHCDILHTTLHVSCQT